MFVKRHTQKNEAYISNATQSDLKKIVKKNI